jgi:hypothetical protein
MGQAAKGKLTGGPGQIQAYRASFRFLNKRRLLVTYQFRLAAHNSGHPRITQSGPGLSTSCSLRNRVPHLFKAGQPMTLTSSGRILYRIRAKVTSYPDSCVPKPVLGAERQRSW